MPITTADNGFPHTKSLRLFCAPDSMSRIGGSGLERLISRSRPISAPFISGVATRLATLLVAVMAYIKIQLEVQAMTHVSATPRTTAPAAELIGENSLIAQIERSHALLSLLSLVDPDRLADAGLGFELVTREVLATLERTERYLAQEKHIVEICKDAVRVKP